MKDKTLLQQLDSVAYYLRKLPAHVYDATGAHCLLTAGAAEIVEKAATELRKPDLDERNVLGKR
jgi:hypothetical protein